MQTPALRRGKRSFYAARNSQRATRCPNASSATDRALCEPQVARALFCNSRLAASSRGNLCGSECLHTRLYAQGQRGGTIAAQDCVQSYLRTRARIDALQPSRPRAGENRFADQLDEHHVRPYMRLGGSSREPSRPEEPVHLASTFLDGFVLTTSRRPARRSRVSTRSDIRAPAGCRRGLGSRRWTQAHRRSVIYTITHALRRAGSVRWAL